MSTKLLIPSELPKSDLLISHIRSVTIETVLLVVTKREHQEHFLFQRELVVTENLRSIGINAFGIDLIPTAVLFLPVHLSPHSVFIKIPSRNAKQAVIFPMDIPLLEYGDSVLEGYIHKIIIILIYPVLEIEIINPRKHIYLFAYIEFKAKIGSILKPSRRTEIRRYSRRILRTFSDDVNKPAHSLTPVKR